MHEESEINVHLSIRVGTEILVQLGLQFKISKLGKALAATGINDIEKKWESE